uniref:Uncharacterized protein n=1 Tax=viral metagenome TaxID=1070528 RepID=A0A6C0BEP4_9ZZZZ
MKALSSISANVYMLQNNNKYLACSSTNPVSIIGFKHRKHAAMVKKILKYHEQTLEQDSTKRFTLTKKSDGTVWDADDINITSCAVVDTCIRFAVNNTQLVIIDDIVETRNKITLYKEDNTAVFVDVSMIKANMEKLLDD